MKRLLPLLIIFGVVIIFFRSFVLHGLLPVPSDTLIGLYHPFRDLYAQQFPRGIPFKNFLITDPIRQQYPWKMLAISMEKQLQLPLWNPYSFSGSPLLANFQSAVLYPLNIFFFFLPLAYSWSVLIFLQPLLGGIFLYLYLRNLKLHPLASLLGAIAFAFSGFSVAWMEWGTVMQTLLWVPLILLAKDKLIVKWTIRWMILFFLAEVASLFAGHLQIWFYAICVTNIYLFLRIFQQIKLQQAKNLFLQYQKNYFPFFLVGVGMLIVTSVQWLPTLQFIFLSARSVDQNYLTTAGWFVPYQHLVQFIVPDFFGNPTTLNYWGVWNYGEFIGYIGILPFLFALFALLARHDKKTYFFGILALVGLVFALPTPFAKIPYQLHIPLLSTSQPTRFMGIVDFALAILAALGFDYFLAKKNTTAALLVIVGTLMGVLIALWLFVLKYYVAFISPTNISVAKHNMIFPTIIFASVAFILLLFILFKKFIPQKARMLVMYALFFITIVDLFRFGDKFIPFTPAAYLYPQTPTITFLQKNIGNYRLMATDSRILPPNVSDVYHLQSIEGYDPLYLENYGAFIAALQRNAPDISTPFGFNRIITPHDTINPLINLLGVKYILSLDDIIQPGLKKVFTEGETKIYENANVLPRAFFVKSIVLSNGQKDTIAKVFANENSLGELAIVEGVSSVPTIAEGLVYIGLYTPNMVSLQTTNQNAGFLVLTDVYYPTWHAYVDGKEAKIYETDFTFRGILVPAGQHTVEFRDQVF